MSAHLGDTIGELRELLADMRNAAHDTCYGIFPGGDPRTFSPDPDSSTEEERARHSEDCAKAERGERVTTETRCHIFELDDGTVASRQAPHGYGFGTYTIEDQSMLDYCERLERYIAQLKGVAVSEDA